MQFSLWQALSRPKGKIAYLVGLLLITGAFGGWLFWGRGPGRAPISLALAPDAAWEGFTRGQKTGLLLLLKDHLEILHGQTVVEAANLTESENSTITRVVLSGKRVGDNLGLEVWIRAGAATEDRWTSALEPPRAAIAACLNQLRTKVPAKLTVLPRSPSLFWDLAEATGSGIEQDPRPSMLLAQRIVEQESDCAGAWASLGSLYYWHISRESSAHNTERFHRCDSFFRKAFDLVPHYPRAVDDFTGFKTDLGNPKEALEMALAAVQKYPRVAHLYGALAYPARISGLLDGASRALKIRDALAGPHRFERDSVENTRLYRGEWKDFERLLGSGSDTVNEPSRDFYRGYIRLLNGHPAQARAFFVRAQRVKGSWVQFETLAHVFELALSDNRAEAMIVLRQLKAERASLRIPDGEFTFKIAEAFAYLKDYDEATETAMRAYAQGFGCTRWYQESPFLAEVPRQARWNSLMQHLKERQELMEQIYPASRFSN